MSEEGEIRDPFLFRFRESEAVVHSKPATASPERGGESNPYEEAPKPEPTKKTPWGDQTPENPIHRTCGRKRSGCSK